MDQLQILVNNLCTALRDPDATEETVRSAALSIIWWELDGGAADGNVLSQKELSAQWALLKRIVQGFKPK